MLYGCNYSAHHWYSR